MNDDSSSPPDDESDLLSLSLNERPAPRPSTSNEAKKPPAQASPEAMPRAESQPPAEVVAQDSNEPRASLDSSAAADLGRDKAAHNPNEPTVRELLENPQGHNDNLDADTLAELQRWFGLPSAMDLPEPEPTPAHVARRDEALAAVDPEFLTYLHRIANRVPLMMEEPHLALRAKEDHATVPERFAATANLGEPREVEIPYLLSDDLKECVPQALLRDLHRVEEYYGIYYDIVKVSEGIPNLRRDINSAISRGEEERKQVMIREQRDLALTDRQMIHAIPWASAAKASPPTEGGGEGKASP